MKQNLLLTLFILTSSYAFASNYTWNNTSGAHDFPEETLTGVVSNSYTFVSKNGTEFRIGGELNWNSVVNISLDGVNVLTQRGESEYGADTPFGYYKKFTESGNHTIKVSFSKNNTSSSYGDPTNHICHVSVKHPVENQTRVRSVTLSEAGDLKYEISDMEKYYITKLTISGPINGDDMRIIYEMAGRTVSETSTSGVLSVLNMENAVMVSGGGICGSYHDIYYGSYGDYDARYHVYTANGVINTGQFYGLSNLTSISLPNSITKINEFAFRGCSNLTSITIPASVTSIGEDAFRGCNSLTTVITPNLDSWCMIDFYDKYANPAYYAHSLYTSSSYAPSSLTIPNECKQIKKFAFAGNTKITSISFPEGMESIGREAFSGCSNLTSITANGGLGNVGVKAFEGCTKISSVNTKNLTEWCQSSFNFENEGYDVKDGYGNYAYEYAEDDEDYSYYSITASKIADSSNPTSFSKSLKVNGNTITEITIPEGVTKIGSAVFYNCNNIRIVHIPASLTSIGYAAFEGCNINRCEISNLSAWSNISFSNYTCNMYYCTLTVDNEHPGYYIPSYSSRVIISNPTSISHNLYYNGELLTNARFEESTTTISGQPFKYCPSQISSLVLPQNITSIGSLAFSGCNNLTSVKVDITTPLSIGSSTFSSPYNVTLYVPAGSGTSYSEAAYWQDFNIVEFIDGDVNSDYETDVLDVVDIARYVVGTPAETFVPILADIDNSGEVNIGDAVCLVNDIAGDQNFARSMAPRHTDNEETLTLALQDDNSLSLALQNMRDYTAFQFDLYVPENVDVMQMMLNAQRKQQHQLLYNKVEEGHWRVAAISTSNRTFLNNSGELLSIMPADVLTDNVTISDIHFFTPDGGDHTFSDISLSSTTAIANLSLSPSSKGEGTIYDLSGRRMEVSSASMLPKGVYIIDGKKVVIK